MGNNATAQQKAAAKSKSLGKQIQEQQKIVATLEKQLKQAKTQYADNEEVQDKYAEKLAKAREALANMRNELERTNTSLNANTNGMSKVANSAGNAATAVFSINDGIKSLANAAGGIADIFSNAFSNTLSIIQNVSSEITALMVQAWTAADDWQSVADVYGGTAETVQRLFTKASYAGFDTGSFTREIDQLVLRTHAGTEEFETALKELQNLSGVELSEDNFDNHLDYFEAVVNALSNVADPLELAQSLFGDKQGSKITQLLAKWNMAGENFK